MATLMQKVGALRAVFGTASDVALPTAVRMMNELMGIVGDGALPAQVERLMELTGVAVAADGAAACEAEPLKAVACAAAGAAQGPPAAAAASSSAVIMDELEIEDEDA